MVLHTKKYKKFIGKMHKKHHLRDLKKMHLKREHCIIPAITVLALGGLYLLWRKRSMIPGNAVPVKPFYKERYLGKWFEIARLDYRFEKNMSDISAEYSLNNDGTIKVVNRGYNYKKGKMEEAVGTAKFADSQYEAKLKVSFFGPFYSGYNVIAIDPDYRYALVAGKNLNYLWLLSRDKSMPLDVVEEYLQIAANIGYDISDLIWTEHSC